MSFTRALNSSLRATKSVSQLTSTRTPTLLPAWMYDAITPSLVARPIFLLAEANPFCRSQSIALSTSSSLSTSACLQSIIPAPVFCRRSLTNPLSPAMSCPLLQGTEHFCGGALDACGCLHITHFGSAETAGLVLLGPLVAQ